MNTQSIIGQFESELKVISALKLNVVDNAKSVIHTSQDCLQWLKEDFSADPPESIDSEIHFFKTVKQIPLQQLIYHAELRSFELQLPKVDVAAQRTYILKKTKKLNRFFLENLVFHQYIKNGSAHFDNYYFTRKHSRETPITGSAFLYRDLEFSTSHDLLLGRMIALEKFAAHLRKRLYYLDHPEFDGDFTGIGEHHLNWTASPTDLVELIYALHYSGCIDHGNTDIKKIAEGLSSLFNIDLSNIYKTGSEIKRRQKEITKFLNHISMNMQTSIESSQS